MKITKYNQSCLLIETNNKKILIDPGNTGYEESLLNEWNNINYIFVTHKHPDHCNIQAINTIAKRDNAVIYTTNEVVNNIELINPIIVKQGDIIDLGNIKIEITKAIHGFFTSMKYNNQEIFENIGIIIDDGHKKIYSTSDTINFNNNYKCDILCMPFNGNGITLGIVDGVMFAQDIAPELVIPVHMEHPLPYMNPDTELLKKELDKAGLKYKFLDRKETIEV